MGIVKKLRKKYVFHKKRWDKKTIDDEKILTTDYALKNKKEIRRAEFLIAKFKRRAKILNKTTKLKESKDALNFIDSLKKKGFLEEDVVVLDKILDLKISDILERRLSTLVYKKKLAKTPSQARQYVIHQHIKVGERVITSPSYLTSKEEEENIQFFGRSALANPDHPARVFVVEKKTTEYKLEEEPIKEETVKKVETKDEVKK